MINNLNRTSIFFFTNLGIFLFILANSSCSDAQKKGPDNTPTSGYLKVFCDEGIQLQLTNQAYTFEKIYPRSKVELQISDEKTAIEALFHDSCKTIAITRNLSPEEENSFKKANLFIQSACIAKTAIAFVVNKECNDSTLSLEELKKLLQGDSSVSKNISQVVFDNENSGSTRFLKDSLLKGAKFGKNCFAKKNTIELIEAISAGKNKIGVLNYSWLSDKDDNVSKDLLKKVKILPISKIKGEIAFYPDQSNIETKDYPLTQNIYMIRRGEDFSLAAGFITFVAGEKGQMMMLKAGLAPFRQPERVIEINMSP